MRAVLFCSALLCCAAGAQERYRESQAGEAAAAGRRRSSDERYNLLLGPIRLKLDAGLDVEYNDNVFAVGNGAPKQDDLFIRPRLNVDAKWQITPLNQLSLRLGLGYDFSLNNTLNGVNPLIIAPNSEIRFDIFAGDFRITLHDAFYLSNNASSQAPVNGTVGFSRFSQFSNDAGVTVLWDLNDIVLTIGLDELTDRFDGTTGQPGGEIDLTVADRDTHSLQLSSAFLLSDTLTAGVQGNALFSSYASGASQQTILTGGPFAQFQVSAYTRFLLAGGVQLSRSTGGPTFRTTVPLRDEAGAVIGTTTVASEASSSDRNDLGYYCSLSVTNRLNASYTHSLSLGHERTFGIASDYQDVDYFRYDAVWQVLPNTTLSGSVGYEKINQIAGLLDEKYSRWSFGLAIGYQVTQHLRAALRYNLYTQDSDRSGRTYDQNLAVLSLNYDF